jgi:hypothetical protein
VMLFYWSKANRTMNHMGLSHKGSRRGGITCGARMWGALACACEWGGGGFLSSGHSHLSVDGACMQGTGA